MKRVLQPLLFSAVAALLFAFANVGQAKADPVTYSTTAQFNGAGGFSSPNSIVFTDSPGNTLTLTFTGVTNAMVNTSPVGFTFASFGQIKTSTTGSGATITSGTMIEIRITQTVPSGGSGDLEATLTGFIGPTSSTGQITFTISHVEINGVQYDVVNNPLALVPPSTNNGVTSIQGKITTPTPEPATLLLLGTGLLGLAASKRSRVRKLESSH